MVIFLKFFFKNLVENRWKQLKTVKSGWKCLKTVKSGWKRMKTFENGWKQLKTVENIWKRMKMVENLCERLKSVENTWKPLKTFENGWKLLKTVENRYEGGGVANERPGNWSCNFRANKRPQNETHGGWTSDRHRHTSRLLDWIGLGTIQWKLQINISSKAIPQL